MIPHLHHGTAMTPQLEITFTGLNLFVQHKDKDQVAVLQPWCLPDADPNNPDYMIHADESRGIPHVGFVAFDLANVGAAIGNASLQGEGVFLFRGHTLDLGIAKGDPVEIKDLPVPDFGKFAPTLKVPANLLPSPAPLMRTVLHGGLLTGSGSQEFHLPQVLNTNSPALYKPQLANSVTWTRTLTGDSIILKIGNLAGTEKTEIPLKLAGSTGKISLNIANVCSENPLGWEDFPPNEILKDDEDFKWLYRLLDSPKPYPQMLLGSPLPIPRAVITNPVGVENCIGGILRDQTFTI
jgi:hypothetical protein